MQNFQSADRLPRKVQSTRSCVTSKQGLQCQGMNGDPLHNYAYGVRARYLKLKDRLRHAAKKVGRLLDIHTFFIFSYK
jgi:hypothetical protein